MTLINDGVKKWLCPSDRELTLRAKLKSGWSFRTNVHTTTPTLSEEEQGAIALVIERANKLQAQDQQRIRVLGERLEAIKKRACGTGTRSCILCGEKPKLFGRFKSCKDCKSNVCEKCEVENIEMDTNRSFWLCKICAEHRELLRKSNLWTQITV